MSMRRMISFENLKHRYHIGKPSGRRTSFRILRQEGSKFTTVQHPTIDTINLNFKKSKIDEKTAEKNLRDLIEEMYQGDGLLTLAVVYNKENNSLLLKYWQDEYAHRDLVDPDTARYELERAVAAAGGHSLLSATRKVLQEHVNANFSGNKQRRIISKLNQILKWLKRDITLTRNRKVIEDVRYLTESDFKEMLKHIYWAPAKILHEVCFYGGFRIGEAFALEPAALNKQRKSIKVLKQVDKSGNKRQTKNDKKRDAYLFPRCIEVLPQWFDFKSRVDLKYRKQISKVTRAACRKAFPDDPSKHLTFHDLRHCYAIALLSKGVSIALVAQSIGDSVRVTEEHYAGFIITSESLEMIDRIVSG